MTLLDQDLTFGAQEHVQGLQAWPGAQAYARMCERHSGRYCIRVATREHSLPSSHSLQSCNARKRAQNFRVRASDLSAGVYYVGVFNMDYFLHSPLTYSLQARHAGICWHVRRTHCHAYDKVGTLPLLDAQEYVLLPAIE